MWKMKAEIEYTAIGSLIFAIIIFILFYTLIFQPFSEGSTNAGEYCTVRKVSSGSWKSSLEVNFDKIYNSQATIIHITPGGWMSSIADKIKIYVNNGSRYRQIGDLENLKENDIHSSLPCYGTNQFSLFGNKKDYCEPYTGEIKKVMAVSDFGNKPSCYVAAATLGPAIMSLLTITNPNQLVSVCAVDKLDVKILYPCKDQMTLTWGECQDGTNGTGWDYVYPLDCKLGTSATTQDVTPCSMENGAWSVENTNTSREITFPGSPIVKIGARAGCAGIQTGCNIRIYAAEPPSSSTEGCEKATNWTNIVNFTDLDYDYIYTKPVDISDYVNINDSKDNINYRLWCLRVESDDSCWLNSIDVAKYVGL